MMKWSQDNIDVLKQNYANLYPSELLNLLPNRTWYAIMKKARSLGLKRIRKLQAYCGVPEGYKRCNRCRQLKPLEKFGTNRSLPDGKAYLCKECASLRRKNRYYKDVENSRKKALERYYRDHENKRRMDNLNKKKRRLDALIHYGGVPPKCACCGESHIEFLCIDHKNGKGNEHRKAINSKGGADFYVWLRNNDYPDGFRVLCHNCNMALALYGYCPHEKVPITIDKYEFTMTDKIVQAKKKK